MKKYLSMIAFASFFAMAGSANALVVDAFDQPEANLVNSRLPNDRYVNLTYDGDGIYNSAGRLIVLGDRTVSGTVNFNASGNGLSSDTQTILYYGTAINRNAGFSFGTSLDITASLDTSFYFDIGSRLTSGVGIQLFDTSGTLLAFTRVTASAGGRIEQPLSRFRPATANGITEAKIGGFSLTFSNLNLSPLNGLSEVGFNIVPATTAAVPEPETYAMFMAGLGLMGFVARRRKV